jgi:protein HOOK3
MLSDAKWFRVSKPTESGDNWVLRVNNLKKIHKMLTRYYDEVLNLSTANLTSPNLNAIAKENNIDELINLCKLIVTAAVQCERRQTYIVEIQRLEPEVQQVLMLSIEEVMAVVVSNVMDAESEMLFSPTASRIDASARLDMNDV